MWLELNSCVKGDNTLFHWLVSHNHTLLSLDQPLPSPPIITNTVPVMCDAAWAYLLSGHWTDLLTVFLILLQFWEDKDIMDSRNRKWCEQCTNTSRLIDYYSFRDSIHWLLKNVFLYVGSARGTTVMMMAPG